MSVQGQTAVAADIIRDLCRIVKAIDDFSKHVQRRHGVSGPQLWALWELRESGKLQVSRLAERMCLHASTVSGIADRLEAKGLATRSRDSEDHRVVGLSITSEGLRLLEGTPIPPRQGMQNALEQMPEAFVEGLAQGLNTLVAVAEAGIRLEG